MRVGDDLNDASYIVDPAGTKYEISASRMAQIDRDLAVLLNDVLDSLFDIQNENEALRARDALRDRAEGQAAFDVVAKLEAAKAERAADKAGFEAVIRELREEVAELKERQLAEVQVEIMGSREAFERWAVVRQLSTEKDELGQYVSDKTKLARGCWLSALGWAEQVCQDEMDDQYSDSEAYDALRACRDRIKGGSQ